MGTAEPAGGGMGWRNSWYYALSELRYGLMATVLCLASVALPDAYMLVLGAWSVGVYGWQQKVLDEVSLTAVRVTCPDAADPSRRFTSAKRSELASLPGASMVFPLCELNASVRLEGGPVTDLVVEGVTPGCPTVASPRLSWGRPLTGPDEAVMSAALFEKLGGSLALGTARRDVIVQVARIRDGVTQVHRHELRLAGLLTRPETDRVYLHQKTVSDLDLWCTSKLELLGPNGAVPASPRTTFSTAVAYVPAEQLWRLVGEQTQFKVKMKKTGEFQAPGVEGPVWAAVRRQDGRRLEPGDRETIRRLARTSAVSEVSTTSLAGLTVVALPAADPRWAGMASGAGRAFGTLVAMPGARQAAGLRPDALVSRLSASVPLGGDAACTPGNLRWLAAPAAAPSDCRHHCLVWPGKVETAARLASHFDFGRDASDDYWTILEDARDHDFESLARITAIAGIRRADPVQETRLGITPYSGESPLEPVTTTVRVVPDWLFERALACGEPVPDDAHRSFRSLLSWGSLDATARASCIRFAGDSLEAVTRLQTLRGTFRVGAQVRLEPEGYWLSELDADLPGRDTRPAGVAVLGTWRGIARLLVGASGRRPARPSALSRLPALAAGLVDQPAASIRDALGGADSDCVIRELGLLPGQTRDGSEELLICTAQALCGMRDVPDALDVGQALCGPRLAPQETTLAVTAGKWRSGRLALRRLSWLPDELFLLPPAQYKEMLFLAAPPPDPSTRSRLDLQFPDAAAFASAARQLAAHRLSLSVLTPLEPRCLVRFEVADALGDSSVDDGLVKALRGARPTFVWVMGSRSVSGSLEGVSGDCRFLSSDAGDPGRFAAGLRAGSWLCSGAGDNQVVLPERLARELGLEPEELSTAPCQVRATLVRGRDKLELPLQVMGIASDLTGPVLAEPLVANLVSWQKGLLAHNATLGQFETPLEATTRAGELRCTVFARDLGSVAPLAGALRRMGYDTSDRLADQEALDRFARLLVLIVLVFASGGLLSSAVAVFLATSQKVRSKTWEIGILKAMGVRPLEIVRVFLLQGILIGCGAFAAAGTAVLVVEPLLRKAICQAFSMRASELLPGGLASSGLWWLYVAVLAIGVGFSLLGVLVPAVLAARLSPSRALRQRE